MIVAVAICLAQAVLASYYPWYGHIYPTPAPVVLPSGYLADTPEVAAAKAAHFAEVAKAGGVVPYTPVVTPEGFLADTPEVAAAKAAHFAEKAKASSAAAGVPLPYPYYPYAYPYPYSVYGAPVVTPAGYLADTPEVAAAKAAHFAEHAKAAHHY